MLVRIIGLLAVANMPFAYLIHSYSLKTICHHCGTHKKCQWGAGIWGGRIADCAQIFRLNVELISDGNVCYQTILNVKSDRFRILERPNNSVHTC